MLQLCSGSQNLGQIDRESVGWVAQTQDDAEVVTVWPISPVYESMFSGGGGLILELTM
jgi:hypothetical protein